MRRRSVSSLSTALTLCCLVTSAGLCSSCVRAPRAAPSAAETHAAPAPSEGVESQASSRVDVNRATRDELERLPGVGPVLAARIVEHRRRHGPFRRPEHLIMVRGMSDSRFRELRPLVTVEATNE